MRAAGRPALRRNVGHLLKGLGAGIAYATLVEPRWIENTHIDVAIPDLPPELDGYRIVHLTDIHHNVVSGRTYLERVVEKANALDGDMVALTGDFVTHNATRLEECLAILRHLRAADGMFATRGNHDYGTPLERIRRMTERVGIRLLENEHAIVSASRTRGWAARHGGHASGTIVVGGVADLWKGIADATAAFDGAPTGHPRVLLSHNPRVAEILPAHLGVALQLSGHTHGGQFRPFQRSIPLFADGSRKYVAGMVQAPHTRVYVGRGVGTSAFYARWNCRPEIALLTLHRVGGGVDSSSNV